MPCPSINILRTLPYMHGLYSQLAWAGTTLQSKLSTAL